MWSIKNLDKYIGSNENSYLYEIIRELRNKKEVRDCPTNLIE